MPTISEAIRTLKEGKRGNRLDARMRLAVHGAVKWRQFHQVCGHLQVQFTFRSSHLKQQNSQTHTHAGYLEVWFPREEIVQEDLVAFVSLCVRACVCMCECVRVAGGACVVCVRVCGYVYTCVSVKPSSAGLGSRFRWRPRLSAR